MSEETPSALDVVESGPEPSDAGQVDTVSAGGQAPEHPSVSAMRDRFGDAVKEHVVSAGDQHVVFVDRRRVREILGWLKDEPAQDYAFLSDVTCVDYGGGQPLHVVYQLWSLTHKRQLRVKARLPLESLAVDSVAPLWQTANWLEREAYDLFGVVFRDHPDLRRILMPENYAEGHPLRKDFPLRGRFSRAEQTRRALSQEIGTFYTDEAFRVGMRGNVPTAAGQGLPEGWEPVHLKGGLDDHLHRPTVPPDLEDEADDEAGTRDETDPKDSPSAGDSA